ncbi:MAG TPA: M1 family aminopeptidase [bacterium]|nr:M1 family aminopeptidase [bacterium]
MTQRQDGIDIGVYFLGDDIRNAREYIDTCSAMLAHFIDVYGFYPFDQYCIVEIPRELTGTMGGSSEQGMNLFPRGMLPPDSMNEYVIAHEIGHSWWGTWVRGGMIQSEVMAQFTATLWFEHAYGEMALRSLLVNGFNTTSEQYGDSYLKMIAMAPETDRMIGKYNSRDASIVHLLADTKGHFVMHMLRDQIGRDAFHRALRRILSEYARDSISLDEFRRVFEAESGGELKGFFDQWFFRTGAPEFILTSETAGTDDGYRITGTIEQPGDVYCVRGEIGVLSKGTWFLHSIDITGTPQPFDFTVDTPPDRVMFDPFNRLLRWRPELKSTPELDTISTLDAVHRCDEAREKLLPLLSVLPDSSRARMLLGDIDLNTGHPSAAREAFQEVIDGNAMLNTSIFNPDVQWAQLKIGYCFDLLGERENAVRTYRQILDAPVIATGIATLAAHSLETPYQSAPVYTVSREKLEEYAGKYAIEGLVFTAWVNDEGFFVAKQENSPEMTLIPLAPDEFGQIGNAPIRVRFVRDPQNVITGIEVWDNGRLLITLTKKAGREI